MFKNILFAVAVTFVCAPSMAGSLKVLVSSRWVPVENCASRVSAVKEYLRNSYGYDATQDLEVVMGRACFDRNDGDTGPRQLAVKVDIYRKDSF